MKPCDLKDKGFTLIELMISLVILGIVIAGIYEVYIQMHKISVSQELKAQTQQTGRVAVDYIQKDLAMAGYRSTSFGNKMAKDKILMANETTIVFDRWLEPPVGANRIIKYFVKADANGKRNLYRHVYTGFDDAPTHWVPTGLDTTYFPDQDKPAIEDISLLTFKYYSLASPLVPLSYATLSGGQVNQPKRNEIVKIEAIIQSKSTKKDPLTGGPVVLTNSFTVIPVNLRTSENVNDQKAPGLVTNLNVIDTCRCSGADKGSLSVKWDKNPEPDIAGYVLKWSRNFTAGPEGNVAIPVESLADRANPTWTIPGLVISKAGDANPTSYYVWAYAYDNSMNNGPECTPVIANPSPSIITFGSGDDTAINVTKPTTPPDGFTAFNILEDATVGQNQIKLTWTRDAEATKGYRIYRLEGSGDFSQPIYNYYTPIADESQLTSNVTTYTDTDTSLKTCQDYRYAICSVNCDETLVRNYDVDDFRTLVKAPSNTAPPKAPELDQTKGGYKRIFVALDNPVRSGNTADFQYTLVYWKRGAYTDPYLDDKGLPTVGYYVLPNSDCGIRGKFTGSGTITTIFNDENTVLSNSVEPNLTAPEYTLLAVSHYKDNAGCRTIAYSTNNTTATVSPSLCADDEQFPGAPPINGGVNPNTPYQAYGGLTVGKSGGCLYNDSLTGVETRQPVTFMFSYGGDGVVYDYSGVYVEKREGGTLLGRWGPLWSSFTDVAPALDSDGHRYDYWFKLADCAYVNGANTTDITSDTDALKMTGIAPGDITGQTGGKVVVFGSFSSIPSGPLFHNAVKFNIVNTADCNISIQRLDNITWSNTDAYLQKVIIGPSTPLGGTASFFQDVAVPDGSTLTGTNRVASVPFTSNPLITDFGTTVGPSVAIPVTLIFANVNGSVDQFVDMRNTTITLNVKYTNTSTNGTCSRTGTINVSLGPIISGVVQDKPLSPTLPFAFVPGSTVTLPSIVVDGGTKVNVNGDVTDSNAALSSVKLFFKTTGQGVTNVDSSGFSQLNMLNPSSSLFTLSDGSTDNRIPVSEGLRVWYYIVAKDADGNFDSAPAAGSGYYTYDQKIFNVCDKTPNAPVLTATKTTTAGVDYGSLSWTAVIKYTDGSDISSSGTNADPIKYDVYRQDGFTGSPAVVASNLTTLTFLDPTPLTEPVIYYVIAKNSCSPVPNQSVKSNLGIICAGTSSTCTVVVSPPAAQIGTHWDDHSLDTPASVDLSVFICDRANDGSVWDPLDGYDSLSDITMTISSAAETASITLYEVDGDSGVFKPLANPNISLPSSANASLITISGNPSLYTGVTLVQGATRISNLSDTVHFTTDAGITSCSGVNADLTVTTDPCSNIPAQVAGVTTPVVSGNNVNISWTAVTRNVDGSTINDLQKYRVYVTSNSGSNFYETTTNSITLSKSNFTQNVTYTIVVSAVDSCNNEGAKSSPGVTFSR